jgi:hypothetical protein
MAEHNVLTDFDGQALPVRQLFDACLEATDPLWDPSVGLVEHPAEEYHPVRASSRYAVGLLVRDDDGDRDRAAATLDAVLDYQFTEEPDAVYFGTWARTPAEHHPMDDPTEWEDYDPNWREFVGTTLALVHDEFAGRLPEDLRERIAEAVRTAAAGTLDRDVTPAYTNIALMRAFLLQWTGDLDGDQMLAQIGQEYADEIHELFGPHETFCEFNSPTYNRVTLNALAQWVIGTGSETTFHERGEEMERALWEQIGQFYHPGLGQLGGPYSRCYRMDTWDDVAYVRLAAGREGDDLPLPAADADPVSSGGTLLTTVVQSWARAPDDVCSALRSFGGESRVERTVGCGDTEYAATAWHGEHVALGGFECLRGPHENGSDQYHTGTFHWRVDGDNVGWGRVRVPGEEQPDARADQGQLRVQRRNSESVRFELRAPGLDVNGIRETEWSLPGLTVELQSNATSVVTDEEEPDRDRVSVTLEPEPDTELAATLAFETTDSS